MFNQKKKLEFPVTKIDVNFNRFSFSVTLSVIHINRLPFTDMLYVFDSNHFLKS